MNAIRGLLLTLCLLAGCSTTKTFEPWTGGPLVRLYYTPLHVIGFMAIHPHLITFDEEGWHRWEVWYTGDLHNDGEHVYKDLFPLNADIGWGPELEMQWQGEEAKKIINALYHRHRYPYKNEYWFWPGPNSNTFISWVLEQAKIEFDPPWRAWGSSY